MHYSTPVKDRRMTAIPDVAVEAAVMAVALAHAPAGTEATPETWNRLVSDVRLALEAAAPHMPAARPDWERCLKRHASQTQHLLDCALEASPPRMLPELEEALEELGREWLQFEEFADVPLPLVYVEMLQRTVDRFTK